MVDLSQTQTQKPIPDKPAGNQLSVTQKPIPPPQEPDKAVSPIKKEETITTPKQKEIKKRLSQLGVPPKHSSKKTKAALGIFLLIATLPAAVYLVKQRQELRKEAKGCQSECRQGECRSTDLECRQVDGAYRCVNPQCPQRPSCICPLVACLDLTASPPVETLKEGEEVNFSCRGISRNKPINHVEFRLRIDGGDWQTLGTTPASQVSQGYQGTIDYSVPQTGSYRVECRVCTSEDNSQCTEWGELE